MKKDIITKGRDTIAEEILKSLKEKFYLFKWVKDK